MGTPTQWLGEFQVNTGIAETGDQNAPRILGLANGSILVAWEESASGLVGTTAGADIVGKLFDAEGNVLREAFQINSLGRVDDERDFDIAATNDGFVMAYIDDSIANAVQTSVIYERFDFDGARLLGPGTGGVMADETVAANKLEDPQIAANLLPSNDDLFIAYEDLTGGDRDVNARTISETDVVSPEFGAARNEADPDRLGDVAVLDDGNFVSVYEAAFFSGTGQSVQFSIRTPAGATVVASQVVGVAVFDPSVASLSGGRFVVTYRQGGDVFFAVYSNGGAFQTNGLAAQGADLQSAPTITALPDGDFVIAWNDATTGDTLARRFNPDGSPDGATFTALGVGATDIDVHVTGDGRILFAARGASGDVFASIWDPRPTVIDPDLYDGLTENFVASNIITTALSGSTVLAGGFEGDTVRGQDGNDLIYSAGAGSYSGGGGDDTIVADASFSGFSGAELLDGGPGHDTLDTTGIFRDFRIDLVTGETNPPQFSFFGESFINFESVLTGTGNDTVIGTGGANRIETGDGQDSIDAAAGDDTIRAGAGDDSVIANQDDGADLIFGGAGHDTLVSSGADSVFGEDGDDVVVVRLDAPASLDGGSGSDLLDTSLFSGDVALDLATGGSSVARLIFSGFEKINAGSGNDRLFGSADGDEIAGNAGADRILGFAGSDTLSGGDDNDTVNGGDGSDSLVGGSGNDKVYAEAGDDVAEGGDGDDLIEGKLGNDQLFGGDGDDTLRAGDGFDGAAGGAGNDTIFGGDGFDALFGEDGDDSLDGNAGDDYIEGGEGNDIVVGGTGDDALYGEAGNDTLRGGGGNDVMDGGIGHDVMFGSANEDTMLGGDGNDRLEGNQQADLLQGGAGNDTLRGGDGFDLLEGGAGADLLVGGNGDDTLYGGLGSDILRGNSQNDTFVFLAYNLLFPIEELFAQDLIDGFDGAGVTGGDVIDLSGIDPDDTTPGDDAFTFLGNVTAAEAQACGPGALWVEEDLGFTLVRGIHPGIPVNIVIDDGAGVTAADYAAGDFIL